jgi:hypothetical protein
MTKKEIIIVNYSQVGFYEYPEDTWNDSSVIYSKNDLLYTCKWWYKESGRTFSNYPFGSIFSFDKLSFQKQTIIVDDNGEKFYGKKIDTDKPDYFDEVVIEFNDWLKNIKDRLPRLREARDKRIKRESELKKLKELTLKYQNERF